MNKWIKLLGSCFLVAATASQAWSQVGKIVRSVRGAAAGVPSVARVVERQAIQARSAVPAFRASAALPVKPLRWRQNREMLDKYVMHTIVPTQSTSLQPRLTSPTISQSQEAVHEYEKFFSDLADVRKEVDPKLGYALLDNVNLLETLVPMEVNYFAERLHGLEFRAKQLQNTLFPSDPALKEAKEYLMFASQRLNKFYAPEVTSAYRSDRPFVQEEFWMEYDWRQGPRDEALTQLPENIHMAVLNDTEDILYMYQRWLREGRFPAGWKVSVYEDTVKLLEDVEAGAKFDLIISDIHVPGGGGRYFVNRLRRNDAETAVIGCSMYTRDKIDSAELFSIGFDGYMYGDDMFEESSGFFKWVSYIKNYYYYKRLGGWKR